MRSLEPTFRHRTPPHDYRPPSVLLSVPLTARHPPDERPSLVCEQYTKASGNRVEPVLIPREGTVTMNLEELLTMQSTCRDEDLVDLRALDYVSSYDAHLMCPICHCAFIDPVRLQCDHVFCQKCLCSAITTFGSDRDGFTCPSCRTPTHDVHTDVPRLLTNMCDDIRVKCPFSNGGCAEIIPRGHVQSHVDKYCGYRLMECPSETCDKETRKKDLDPDQKCMHELRPCSYCEEEVMEQDYEEHINNICPSHETICPDCQIIILQKELKEHIDICPDVIHSCTASKYGCPAKVKRADLATHEGQCPLVLMRPYFEAQNSRFDSLELTVRHLQQRNEIFEDGISTIRSTLVDTPRTMPARNSLEFPTHSSAQPGPSTSSEVSNDQPQADSSSTTYLLSLHESLREEVGQLSHAITDLDARASMTIMNECLRIKEDMAHTNAAVNSVRMQVQWLMNPRLHQGQRTSNVRTNDTNESRTTTTATPGPSNASGPSSGSLRPRRLSDSAREGTKL